MFVKVLIVLLIGTKVLCYTPQAYMEPDYLDELIRLKRATICVEILPSSPKEEPYYMCKGKNLGNNGPIQRFSEINHNVQNLPYNVHRTEEPYAKRLHTDFQPTHGMQTSDVSNNGFRAPISTYEGNNANEEQRFPFKKFILQTPQKRITFGNENRPVSDPATNKFFDKNAETSNFNRQAAYELPPKSGNIYDTSYVHQPTTTATPTTFTKVYDDDKTFIKPSTHHKATLNNDNNNFKSNFQQKHIQNLRQQQNPQKLELEHQPHHHSEVKQVNKDLHLFTPTRTIPIEYMEDPILRTFYEPLIEPNSFSAETGTLRLNSGLGQNGFLINLEKGTKVNVSPVNTPTATALKPEPAPCTQCANATPVTPAPQTPNCPQSVNNNNACSGQEMNFPPLVIAMPCFGQTPNSFLGNMANLFGNTGNTYNPPLGVYPSVSMENMYFNPLFNTGRSEEAINENKPQNRANIEESMSTVPTTIQPPIYETTMINTEKPKQFTNLPNLESEDSDEIETTTDVIIHTTEHMESAGITETTEDIDKSNSTETGPRSFKIMLNKAKQLKEVAAENINLQKKKRQNVGVKLVPAIMDLSGSNKY